MKRCLLSRILLFFGLLALAGPSLALQTEIPPAAQELGCMNCHAIDHKVVGPAWIDVAKRYRDGRNDPTTISTLVKKVSRGGAGNWGDVPMVANDPVGKRQDKIQELVKFVLSLSDQPPQHQGKN